jgi:hypothetical protein
VDEESNVRFDEDLPFIATVYAILIATVLCGAANWLDRLGLL